MDGPDSSTPRSTTTETQPLKAAKDKNCPFCGQSFTSSSLGRHLDLYIRPKNPKPADGIHLVDEIRKLRDGITRRQAKGSVSLCKKDDGDSADEEDAEPHGKTPGRRRDGGKARTQASRVRVSRHVTTTAHLEQRGQTSSEEAEIASATEMALRELLKSVREASTKACGAALFDFDPCSLSFPALCLHMLPAPPTLFSPTPFPTAESWATTPPGPKQLDALNKQVRERLLRQRHINQASPNAPLPTPPLFDPDPQKLFCHIADAFSHWMRHSERTRQEYWQIEILRCYARADDARREAEAQLEKARREIDRLKAIRWASGAADISPITINLGTDTTTELGRHGMDFRNWDYDRLIDKWRAVVRESKANASGMATQRPLPGPPASTRSCSTVSITPHPFSAVNQPRQASPVKVEGLPFTAPPTVVDEPGSDQIDAQGDDDEDVDLDQHTPPEDHAMNEHQPNPLRPQHQQHQQQHHMPLQPTSLHHTHQVQAHMQNQMHVSQAQAQAQAQLHAQANAQAHAQAQAWAAARQHMNQSRNQNFSPHQHQQLPSHVQHVSRMGSAASSRRPSVQMMDPHAINQNAVNGMQGGMTMATGMEGIQSHQDQFLGMDMGLTANFVGQNDRGLGMGS